MDNLNFISKEIHTKSWLVACLCAAWCETCQTYRRTFDQLSQLHQDKCFAWIDIEDNYELVEEVEVENFPTILIQYNDKILFFGTVLPDLHQLHRMLQSLEESKDAGMEPTPLLSTQQRLPDHWNLRKQLAASIST